jgi:hypothetical protein
MYSSIYATPEERGEDGRRNQGDCQDGPEEKNPAVPRPPGRTEDLLRVAAGAGGHLPRGEGTEREAHGKGGVRVGLENSILDIVFNGAVLFRVRKLKGPDNEGR